MMSCLLPILLLYSEYLSLPRIPTNLQLTSMTVYLPVRKYTPNEVTHQGDVITAMAAAFLVF